MYNCNNCKYKANIAGDSHISCKSHIFNDKNIEINLVLMALSDPEGFVIFCEKNFGFSVNIHGLVNGWFMFPINFDPSWMEGHCDFNSYYIEKFSSGIKELIQFYKENIKYFLENRHADSIFDEEKEIRFLVEKSKEHIKNREIEKFKTSFEILKEKWNKVKLDLYQTKK